MMSSKWYIIFAFVARSHFLKFEEKDTENGAFCVRVYARSHHTIYATSYLSLDRLVFGRWRPWRIS